MRMLPATHRYSPPLHVWKPHNMSQTRPSGSSPPRRLDVRLNSGGRYESRRTESFSDCLPSFLPLCWTDGGPSSCCYCCRVFEDGEWGSVEGGSRKVLKSNSKIWDWNENLSLSQTGLLLDGLMSLPRDWDSFYISKTSPPLPLFLNKKNNSVVVQNT